MKLTAVKRVAAVLLGIVMLFVLNCSAYAETIQDSLQKVNDMFGLNITVSMRFSGQEVMDNE
mgnify:CR=1 FL=1